ncbi:unnamed protein product, partial [Prunus brigantina]
CSSGSLTKLLTDVKVVCQKRKMENKELWELKAPFPQLFQWEAPFLAIFLLFSFLLPWPNLMKERKWIYMLVQRMLLAAHRLIFFGSLNVSCLELAPPHVLEPPAALFNKSSDLPHRGFYFSSK